MMVYIYTKLHENGRILFFAARRFAAANRLTHYFLQPSQPAANRLGPIASLLTDRFRRLKHGGQVIRPCVNNDEKTDDPGKYKTSSVS